MPIFCYACPKCGQNSELIRKIAEATSPAFCDKCGSQMDRTPEVPFPFTWGLGGPYRG